MATTEKLGKIKSVSSGGRGISYPAISLGEAIERARQFWDRERKNAAPLESAAAHWGYSPSSSGVRTLVAALLSFGLLTDKGSAGHRQVQLTPRAMDIILDTPERAKALLDAVKSPKIYMELMNEYGTMELPSDHTIRSYLLRHKNFNPKAVDSFIKDFRSSLGFSGAANADNIPSVDRNVTGKLDANEMVDELMRQPESITKTPITSRAHVTGVGAVATVGSVTTVTTSEIGAYPVAKNCTIRLVATGPYTRKSIEALVKQLELNLQLDVFPDEPAAEQ